MSEQKDTIYIDIDDEITSIIEKVRGSKHKIVALVLPKRATTLQSIVNMKLLKRTADESKKHLVLITSEAGLLPLAGAVGLHVAKTLQSKPAIPPPPDMSNAEESVVDEEVSDDEPELDDSKSIGELAGLATAGAIGAAAASGGEETIDIDNSDAAETDDKKSTKKKSKDKIKVPNFNKFRMWLIIGSVLLAVLVVAWYYMFRVLPKATVIIQTNNQSASTTVNFTADTATKTLNLTTSVAPAEIKDIKETASQTATATGQKNIGNKASGTVQFYNCNKDDTLSGNPETVAAGTGISANGLTYITQQTVNVPPSHFNGNNCKSDQPSSSINVIAQQGGSQYNSSQPVTYTVSGFTTITANGDSMSGGTDQNVTVLSQSDIDNAKQKITANTTQAQNDLTKALKTDNEFPLTATLVSDPPTVTTSANAGDQVANVTVTVVTTYHMLGVKEADLQLLTANSVKGQIDTSKQQIFDYGLDQATFTVTSKQSANNQTLAMQTTVVAGANINVASLNKQIVGKKKGDIAQLIGALPSVQTVTVNYSPFWVTTTPHKSSRITIVVQKSNTTTNGKSK